MRTQGRKLSRQARAKLNTVLLDWLNENKGQIDDCCLLAELFGKTRWREAPLERLRAGMGSLIAGLRVRCGHTPSCCEVATLEELSDRPAGCDELIWERLSTPIKGAFGGQDHSTIIKNEAKVIQKESSKGGGE